MPNLSHRHRLPTPRLRDAGDLDLPPEDPGHHLQSTYFRSDAAAACGNPTLLQPTPRIALLELLDYRLLHCCHFGRGSASLILLKIRSVTL